MNKKEVIIFGTTICAKRAFELLKYQSDVSVVNFTDNNTEKYWTEFCCTLVIPLGDAITSKLPIIICSEHNEMIAAQLKSLHVKEYYLNVWEYLKSQNRAISWPQEKNTNTGCIQESCLGNGSTYYKNDFSNFAVLYQVNETDRMKYPFDIVKIGKETDLTKYSLNFVALILSEYDLRGVDATLEAFKQNKKRNGINVLICSGQFKTEICKLLPYVDFVLSDQISEFECYRSNYTFQLQEINSVIDTLKYNPIALAVKQSSNIFCLAELSFGENAEELIQLENDMFFGCIEATEFHPYQVKILDKKYQTKCATVDAFLKEYLIKNESNDEMLLRNAEYFVALNKYQWSNQVDNNILKALAYGKTVLTNYNRGLSNFAPNVYFAYRKEDVINVLTANDREQMYEMKVRNIRSVHKNFSLLETLASVNTLLGCSRRKKRVLVVLKENSKQLHENYCTQTYEEKDWVYEADMQTKNLEEYDFIAFFGDNRQYGMYYLEDMINGFKYTNSDFVTKDSYVRKDKLVEGTEYNYVQEYHDKYRTVFSTEHFHTFDLIENEGNGKGYSVDHLEYAEKKIEYKKKEVKYKISVIIPVYNNGEQLEGKALKSLLICSMFEDLQIVLVDDGSTDNYTAFLVQKLSEKYENIISYTFEKGGSGSPSRARNKGFELASSEYVICLDPDDEVCYDSYEALYDEIAHSGSDAVLGNIYWIDCNNRIQKHNYYNSFLHRNNGVTFTKKPDEFIKNSNFEWIGFCNFLIRKDVIISERKKITQKLGILSEDYLFINELFLNCKKVKAINKVVYYYYTKNSNSLTNVIDSGYFYKKRRFVEETYNLFLEYNIDVEQYESVFVEKYKSWFVQMIEYVSDNEFLKCMHEAKMAYRCFRECFGYDLMKDKVISDFLKIDDEQK